MMNNAVEVIGLRVERGGNVVLRDIDLTVPEGTVTGLLGPSGCGKSTLMRAMVGVQQIESGQVIVLGRPAGARELRSQIGYVTQSASVYDDLTVVENLHFFAQVLGVPRDRVAACVERVDLQQFVDTVVGELSGGQRSRVSLAVALLGEPQLLVLDEPTVGLDPVLRQQLWATFHELADRGVAVFVSSHVMDEAERCDRLLLMREGSVIADDTPAALRERTRAKDIEGAFLAIVRGKGFHKADTSRGGVRRPRRLDLDPQGPTHRGAQEDE
ncbi:MAG: ABC transporter ATP-binding protein [Marmoricola sp.]